MKRFLALPLVLCFLLGGCNNGEETAFNRFREELCKADSISFTAEVRAEYEDKTAEFTVAFNAEGDEYRVRVLEPELVKGISAHVKSGETHLEYDGVILDIGKLNDRGLCPMSALPYLTDSLKDAHLDLAWSEGELIVLRLVPSDDMSITLWLDGEVPVNAEIIYKEKTVVFVTIHDWETNTNEGLTEKDVGGGQP